MTAHGWEADTRGMFDQMSKPGTRDSSGGVQTNVTPSLNQGFLRRQKWFCLNSGLYSG